jgi:hypothetical protein
MNDPTPAVTSPARRPRRNYHGRAQLSLVEHALCPLDPANSLVLNLMHETSYEYTDKNKHTKTAKVRVLCPFGLSASDEFTLWGLLALTFSQPDQTTDFEATPHFCLRQLGIISDGASKGGKQYQMFRETIRRLSRVLYENSAFYDPIRGEHRDVAFGLLKYSLPIDPKSSRTWRFLWDQQFFEFSQATGGSFHFDLGTYRQLDPASRRLFVLLQKIFWRHDVSPSFDLRKLAVGTLGFSSTMEVWDLRQRIVRCTERLIDAGILRLPLGVTSPRDLFTKRGVGKYVVSFHRGPYFDRPEATRPVLSDADSPLVDPLKAIGFDDAAIRRMLRTYSRTVLQTWADITLAAREKHGEGFFSKSAAAYFLDNVKHAAEGTRTAPDWWRQLRVQELRREQEERPVDSVQHSPAEENAAFRAYLETEARETFNNILTDLKTKLQAAGSDPRDADEKARQMVEPHFRHRFRDAHPEWSAGGPSIDLADLMKRKAA